MYWIAKEIINFVRVRDNGTDPWGEIKGNEGGSVWLNVSTFSSVMGFRMCLTDLRHHLSLSLSLSLSLPYTHSLTEEISHSSSRPTSCTRLKTTQYLLKCSWLLWLRDFWLWRKIERPWSRESEMTLDRWEEASTISWWVRSVCVCASVVR